VPDAPEAMYAPLVARYRHHFLAQDAEILLFDGAREMIIELFESGYSLGVATGKNTAGLNRVLESSGMKRYFHATRTAEQTVSKPHPAMLLELMAELAVNAGRTLMVGDTTHDVMLAQNAGVDVVAVAFGAHPAAQLLALQPLALMENFTQLRTWFKENA